jgi:hypothetical protein
MANPLAAGIAGEGVSVRKISKHTFSPLLGQQPVEILNIEFRMPNRRPGFGIQYSFFFRHSAVQKALGMLSAGETGPVFCRLRPGLFEGPTTTSGLRHSP